MDAVITSPETGPLPLAAPLHESLLTFYRLPTVRGRILEFLGGATLAEASAPFVVTAPLGAERPFQPIPSGRLWPAVERDLELSRSLWDRRGLLAHLDLEHVHFDCPWETFTHPERAFALQQPVVTAIEALLASHGIAALHVLTGRGHHWTWRVDNGSAALAELAELGQQVAPDRPDSGVLGLGGEVVSSTLAAAHDGLGRLLEHAAHRLLRALIGALRVPLQVTAVAVGCGSQGREIVSLDLSEYGDPLGARSVRAPFSIYLKASRASRGSGSHPGLAPIVPIVVPPAMPLDEALATRRPASAAALAACVSARIPESTAGTASLLASYRGSPVSAFHEWYYSVTPEPPERWPATYDRLDLADLPACARLILERPNDLILRPAHLQHLVRVLTARGWHPRHVAGLVRSKLERDHGWLGPVHFFDAEVRADFYVRLFAGLALLGTDSLVDFNCASAAEKGLCPGGCHWNVADLRSALQRREARS